MAGVRFPTGLNQSPQPPRLKFGDYLTALPPIPETFGHQDKYPPRGWGMLGNDVLGDCSVAGAMHCIMLWNAIVSKTVTFSALDAKDDYFAITGGQDIGADMVQMASYWRNTGFRDIGVNRHKIVAFVQVDARLDYVDAACYWFDAVGLGIWVGSTEMQEFVYEQPWITPGDRQGYHFVPMVGKDNLRKIVTWGGTQDVGPEWLQANLVEVIAMVSQEAIVNGKSAEGFNMDALMADLQSISA